MLTQNEVKTIRSLQQKKYRNIHKRFVAEGPKLIEELIGEKICAKKEWLAGNSERIQKEEIPFTLVSDKELIRISGMTTPNDVLAVIRIPEESVPPETFTNELILALDDIKDPGNLGTIVRTADWFGINHIVCSENSVDCYNPKVVQATMGSVARVNIYYANLKNFLEKNAGKVSIFGAYTDGEDVYTIKPTDCGIIVIGNESGGISGELEPFIQHRISIPSYRTPGEKHSESLNASVAAAILCYAFRKNNIG